MRHTLKSISCSVLLLVSAALPPVAHAQATGMAPPVKNVVQDSLDVPNKQHERAREDEKLLDETQLRISAERKLKLNEALKEDKAALEQSRQLLVRLFELPDTLKLSVESRALAEATLQPQRALAAAA